jgi:hypothetical protein
MTNLRTNAAAMFLSSQIESDQGGLRPIAATISSAGRTN